MALIPDRAVVLTAASTSVTDVMAAYYADLGSSAWSATDHTSITAGAPGSFSMTLRNAGGTIELNMLNDGSVGTPSTTTVRLGINPDGSSDPITKSEDPYDSGAGPANFSGTDNGSTGGGAAVIGSPEFIVLEWPDGLMFIFKDALKSGAPWLWYWGKIWTPLMATLASMGSVRMDGHAIMSGIPNNTSYALYGYQQNGASAAYRFRNGTGVVVDGVPPFLGSWVERVTSTHGPIMQRLVTRDSRYFSLGPEHEVILLPCRYGADTNNTVNSYPFYFIDNHLRNVPTGNSCFDMWTIGGLNRYMVVWHAYSTGAYVAVPVPDDFNPSP